AARVRIVGEAVWPERTELEYPACVQHEAMVNTAFEDRPAWMLCPYDATALAPHVVRDVETTHPTVVEDGRRRSSTGYREPFLTAEEFNRPLPAPPAAATARRFGLASLADARRLVAGSPTRRLSADQVEDLVLAVNRADHEQRGPRGRLGHAAGVAGGRRGGVRGPRRGQADRPDGRPEQPGAHTPGGYGVMLVNLLCDLVRVHTGGSGTAIRVYVGPPA
ncbi:MEDS domain-containing protein, partial [Saccharothrix sp. MB29]|nr:MEDS domain-containing protein [Saccharothrix sp. MB29]